MKTALRLLFRLRLFGWVEKIEQGRTGYSKGLWVVWIAGFLLVGGRWRRGVLGDAGREDEEQDAACSRDDETGTEVVALGGDESSEAGQEASTESGEGEEGAKARMVSAVGEDEGEQDGVEGSEGEGGERGEGDHAADG